MTNNRVEKSRRERNGRKVKARRVSVVYVRACGLRVGTKMTVGKFFVCTAQIHWGGELVVRVGGGIVVTGQKGKQQGQR